MMKNKPVNIPLVIWVVAVGAMLLWISFIRLDIDYDIVGALPQKDPVLSDAKTVIRNHPLQDQIVIDIELQPKNPDRIVRIGDEAESRLAESGLFETVGIADSAHIFPELMLHITRNLPVLFSAKMLDEKIKPLLTKEAIRNILQERMLSLLQLDGVGQSELLIRDPLGFGRFIMEKISNLAPSKNARVYKNHLVSSDGAHLLILAKPKYSGTDTVYARKIAASIEELSIRLDEKFPENTGKMKLTAMGAYRAALDNETIVRKDTRKAILLSMIGVSLLLSFAFPRPYMGLLSLLPAVFGTIAAFFVFSLIHRSVSILTIGFGGAIISITVDHGIAYMLFLDRPYETRGRQAAREVWSVGLLAAMTTVGAFLSLSFSGFAILSEIGQFAALGIGLSFVFVHTVLPYIFPVMPPPKKERTLPLTGFVNGLAQKGGKTKFGIAVLFCICMFFFAKPTFKVDLTSMNTVKEETLAAERLITTVWGNVLNRVYLMVEADDVQQLQNKVDELTNLLETDLTSGTLASGFTSSMIFPGAKRIRENISAWDHFWNEERVRSLKENIRQAAVESGFTEDAFEPFSQKIESPETGIPALKKDYFELFGISRLPNTSALAHFIVATPGKTYDAASFYDRYHDRAKIFDPQLFSQRLGSFLYQTFLKMALIIGASVVLLLFLFFLDWQLTLTATIPIVFAFICTLGVLNIIGRPLDIPGLMLSIIVLGMGVDYSLFLVRSRQRYLDASHPLTGVVRTAVFLASASTLTGFGAMAAAEHSLLKSAGITSFLGIGFALIGAFALLPFLTDRLFTRKPFPKESVEPGAKDHIRRVIFRYRHLDAYPRLFARFKMVFDSMFSELHTVVQSPKVIVDIGCGYGVPAAWISEIYPDAYFYGIDPDGDRVRIASRIVGEKGTILEGQAPDIPFSIENADYVMMLDMIHYLSDKDLEKTVKKSYELLTETGRIVLRTTIPVNESPPFLRRIEEMRLKLTGKKPFYRSVAEIKTFLHRNEFQVKSIQPSGKNREEVWIVAVKT